MKPHMNMMRSTILSIQTFCTIGALTVFVSQTTYGQKNTNWKIQPDYFKALTEPPCSYVATEHRKGFVDLDDKAVAWLRGPHNGGAIPLKHFLTKPRIINDTYGLFFYDPEGGYVAAYEKDYGYSFYGWFDGMMMVRDEDGTVWSALSGKAVSGPGKGKRLNRVPSMTTSWGHWLMLHPESTAYNLFKGETYPVAKLPATDPWIQLPKSDIWVDVPGLVLGVESGDQAHAFTLPLIKERACFNDVIGEKAITVFWYGTTQSAVAWDRKVNGKLLTFRADEIAPPTAPFMDNETNTRWTLAGRAVDGPLRGTELNWIDSIQCREDAWEKTYPETTWYIKDSK